MGNESIEREREAMGNEGVGSGGRVVREEAWWHCDSIAYEQEQRSESGRFTDGDEVGLIICCRESQARASPDHLHHAGGVGGMADRKVGAEDTQRCCNITQNM